MHILVLNSSCVSLVLERSSNNRDPHDIRSTSYDETSKRLHSLITSSETPAGQVYELATAAVEGVASAQPLHLKDGGNAK